MSDLYRTSSSSTSSALSPESEALSSFLNHQLHNSSSAYSSVSLMSMKRNYSQFSPPLGASPTPLRPSVQYRLPSECLPNFPDPSGFFVADAKESAENAFPSTGVVDSDANTTLMKMKASSENDSEGCEAEVSDLPSNLDPPRSLSKRTRAAEVHNLSEKRRRSRINEKLKALQNLIPNSSKTDKASMLDEAIEYLKQLQLQVQMLSMRNGMSLHPLSLPVEVMRPMQLYQAGINPDIGNIFLPLNQGRDAFSGNEEFSVSNKCSLPDSKPITHSTTNIANSQTTLYGVGQQIQPCYGNFNLSTSSKDICRDATTKEQLDDLPQTGKSPSGAVS